MADAFTENVVWTSSVSTKTAESNAFGSLKTPHSSAGCKLEKRNKAFNDMIVTWRESRRWTVGLLGCSRADTPPLSFTIPLTMMVGLSGLKALTYWSV